MMPLQTINSLTGTDQVLVLQPLMAVDQREMDYIDLELVLQPSQCLRLTELLVKQPMRRVEETITDKGQR